MTLTVGGLQQSDLFDAALSGCSSGLTSFYKLTLGGIIQQESKATQNICTLLQKVVDM
jgi:hypothetical protein